MSCPKGGKRSRKTKGGAYGFGGGVINAGNPVYDKVDTAGAYLPSGGKDAATNALYSGGNNAIVGGRKSRKSRKTKKSKKTRKTRGRRRMRGGMWSPGNVNAGGAGYGFVAGDPTIRGGIAPVAGYNSRMGGAPMGGDGVRPTSS